MKKIACSQLIIKDWKLVNRPSVGSTILALIPSKITIYIIEINTKNNAKIILKKKVMDKIRNKCKIKK